MKYLSDYTDEPMSAALEKHGAFFAFGMDQLKEKSKPGVKYVQLGGMGLICPKANADELHEDMGRIIEEGQEQDLAENSKDAIIDRELANHECWYTGNIEDCVNKLHGYPVTELEIRARYQAGFEAYYAANA